MADFIPPGAIRRIGNPSLSPDGRRLAAIVTTPYEDIVVDQVMLIMQTETIPHDKVMESIELYGKEVIPAFRNGGNGK